MEIEGWTWTKICYTFYKAGRSLSTTTIGCIMYLNGATGLPLRNNLHKVYRTPLCSTTFYVAICTSYKIFTIVGRPHGASPSLVFLWTVLATDAAKFRFPVVYHYTNAVYETTAASALLSAIILFLLLYFVRLYTAEIAAGSVLAAIGLVVYRVSAGHRMLVCYPRIFRWTTIIL